MIWQTGEVYEGNWSRDKRSGLGTLLWNGLGDKYVGEFSEDNLHGRGQLHRSDGSVWKGSWNFGRKGGPGAVQVSSVRASLPGCHSCGHLKPTLGTRLPSLQVLERSNRASAAVSAYSTVSLVPNRGFQPYSESIANFQLGTGKPLVVRTLL
jgi:hypothetical protein